MSLWLDCKFVIWESEYVFKNIYNKNNEIEIKSYYSSVVNGVYWDYWCTYIHVQCTVY